MFICMLKNIRFDDCMYSGIEVKGIQYTFNTLPIQILVAFRLNASIHCVIIAVAGLND